MNLGIIINLEEVMAWRHVTLTALAHKLDTPEYNLMILQKGRAKAISFPALLNLCDMLCCEVEDLV